MSKRAEAAWGRARVRTRAARVYAGEKLGRLPIRLRLTLAFAGVMIVLFGGIALLLYLRFGAGLDAGIKSSLQARAADLSTVAREAGAHGSTQPKLEQTGGAFAQILDPHGHVIDSTPGLRRRALLTPSEATRTLQGQRLLLDRGEGERLLAQRITAPTTEIAVVGISLAERDHALGTLGDLLFVGGPFALLLVCGAGYALTAGALAPVEGMRRRADRISGARLGDRLPVPDAHDELHRLGETLNEMLARLEDAMARERAFVADASHELRTPLSILKLELDLALSPGRSRAELEAALRSAVEEVDRLTRLAQDLLVIARADQGQLPVQRQCADLDQVLQATADRFARAEGSPRGSVTVEGARELVVDADPARLEQALDNMVDNALRHGEGPVTVRVDVREGQVEIHVLDRGPGLPSHFLSRAFERFSRADPARSGEGTGLGLAIVRAIAEAHGGRAGVANRPGGGAHVWLAMPHAVASADGGAPEPAGAELEPTLGER